MKATAELEPASNTPGHTIGPFFHDALEWAATGTVDHPAQGAVRIEGTVEDGSGKRLPAWMIEAWVPAAVTVEEAAGLEAPGFRRCLDDDRGTFSFRVPTPEPGQPAAFVTLFGLGLTRHQHTAVYLAGDRAGDLLAQVPAERRGTLVAERIGDEHYRWTIRTQGERETVFFEYR